MPKPSGPTERLLIGLHTQVVCVAKALDHLLKALSDKNCLVREATAEALGRQSSLSDAALNHLLKTLSDEDSSVRQATAYALGGANGETGLVDGRDPSQCLL